MSTADERVETGLTASAHLHTQFQDRPLLQRPAAARALGFETVDLWWPFDGPDPSDREVDALAGALDAEGLQVASFNADGGDLPGGDRGFACDPSAQERFNRAVASGLDVVQRLGGSTLNVLYGNRPDGVDIADQDALAIENLTAAATTGQQRGVRVVLEALNDTNTPRYPIRTAAEARTVIDAVADRAPLGFLFDQYHLNMMGEDLQDALALLGEHTVHVQIADVPGRGQPGTGAVDFAAFFDALLAHGYHGAVGLEYLADTDEPDALRWMAEHPQLGPTGLRDTLEQRGLLERI